MVARTLKEFVSSKEYVSREPKKMVLRAQNPGAREGWTRQLIEIHEVKVIFNTGGPLLTLFFKTLEKVPCKQKTV